MGHLPVDTRRCSDMSCGVQNNRPAMGATLVTRLGCESARECTSVTMTGRRVMPQKNLGPDNISFRECPTRTSCHELKENGRLTSHTIPRCATARPEKERARARESRHDVYHAYAHTRTTKHRIVYICNLEPNFTSLFPPVNEEQSSIGHLNEEQSNTGTVSVPIYVTTLDKHKNPSCCTLILP